VSFSTESPGVYQIRLLRSSGRVYVGSSFNIIARWRQHLHHLRKGTHHSKRLQFWWGRSVPEDFAFEVVIPAPQCSGDVAPEKDHILRQLEQDLIDHYKKSYGERFVVNAFPSSVSAKGYKLGKEGRRRRSQITRSWWDKNPLAKLQRSEQLKRQLPAILASRPKAKPREITRRLTNAKARAAYAENHKANPFLSKTAQGLWSPEIRAAHLKKISAMQKSTEARQRTSILAKNYWEKRRASVTHCRNGHEYTVQNTISTALVVRGCRACARAGKIKWRAKKKLTGGEI